MLLALWLMGLILLVDGIVIVWLRRRGMLVYIPAFIPLLAMSAGALTLIAAFFASR